MSVRWIVSVSLLCLAALSCSGAFAAQVSYPPAGSYLFGDAKISFVDGEDRSKQLTYFCGAPPSAEVNNLFDVTPLPILPYPSTFQGTGGTSAKIFFSKQLVNYFNNYANYMTTDDQITQVFAGVALLTYTSPTQGTITFPNGTTSVGADYPRKAFTTFPFLNASTIVNAGGWLNVNFTIEFATYCEVTVNAWYASP